MVVERVDGSLRVDVPPESAQEVTRVLAQTDQWVTELRPVRFSLEDVFLELTTTTSADIDSSTDLAATTREEVIA